ncbi:MAG TPA: GGDEF domain-containing protein, partial [Acidobacteriaceae bacterium]|nr:GGDEF domain-containing protein [Acidobacteriaceae bacterium]
VHLARAQVTFYQAEVPLLFLQDSTDGIFVHMRGQPPASLRCGDIVAVDGFTGSGKLTPVIVDARFRLLGHAPLPKPAPTSFDRVLAGAVDSQWIAVRGIIRSIRPVWDGDEVAITLASGPDRLEVMTPDFVARNPGGLVDARVVIRAAAGARFNDRKQLIGTYLFMPDMSYLEVEVPAIDTFTRPPRRVEDVMRPPQRGPGHRVHVQGVVTSTWGNQHFSLMAREHGIFVATEEPVTVHVGDVVDAAGFPAIGDYTAVLENSILRQTGTAPPPAAVHLTAAEALAGDHDAESIEVDALYLDHTREDTGSPDMVLSADGISFLAVLPPGSRSEDLERFKLGSRLRVRGICVIHVADDKTPRELSILLRSPEDIVVLHRPSWWTTGHTLLIVLPLGAVILIVVVWNLVLRQQVRRHTDTIRQQLREADALRVQAEAAHQEKSDSLASVLLLQHDLLEAQEKLRHQATHDALTGLWNRRALLELLEKELERCGRTGSSIGILMADVDHFKPVNDTLGHLAGDQVLKEIALRITHATRGYDLCGRYGGEEFLILLPGCNGEETQAGAERIRMAIASAPFRAAGSTVNLTISIGATLAPQCARTETELLSLADQALYEAKNTGRNRTVVCTAAEV